MKLLVVGHGRAGKDEFGLHMQRVTNLKFAGTTSKYLCKYVAERLGVSEEEAFKNRHEQRNLWYEIGNEIRKDDPGKLIKEALQYGDITGGVRDIAEVKAAKNQRLVDLIIWVDNIWVPVDPTLKFSQREADIIIPNHWGLLDFHERIKRLAKILGIYQFQC